MTHGIRSAAAVLLAPLGLAAAAHAFEYELIVVDPLDPSGIPEVYLWDINDQGVACGTSTNQGTYDGFVWTSASGKSAMSVMDWPSAINNANVVVGASVVHDSDAGTSQFIPPTDTFWAFPEALDINDAGTVVGYTKGQGSNSNGMNQIPLWWDAANGLETIQVAGAKELLRVNSSDVAVGNIRHSASADEGFVLDLASGALTNLHALFSPSGLGTNVAVDINDAGVVAGEGWNGSVQTAYVWSAASGFTLLPPLPGGASGDVRVEGLNDTGLVVGSARDASGWVAFVWDPVNGTRDLNGLVDGQGFLLDRAQEINDAGWIVGYGHHGPGFGVPLGFVLRPLGATSAPLAGAAPAPGLRLAVGASNPFRFSVALEYDVATRNPVSAAIHDVTGRRVATLLRGGAASQGRLTWNGRSDDGRPLAGGVYFARLVAGGSAWTVKLVKR